MRPRNWTDDQLIAALEGASSVKEVIARLREVAGSASWQSVRRRMRQLDLDPPGPSARKISRDWSDPDEEIVVAPPYGRRWSDDELRVAVAATTSVAGTIRALGLVIGGGQYRAIKRRIAELGIDTSHHLGQASNRGRSMPRPKRPLSEILVEGTEIQSHQLRLRLVREGLKEARCESCGLDRWMDAPIPLQLDHINGDPTDNRLENLRILCPNCHAQTPTWCGKNIGGRRDHAPLPQFG